MNIRWIRRGTTFRSASLSSVLVLCLVLIGVTSIGSQAKWQLPMTRAATVSSAAGGISFGGIYEQTLENDSSATRANVMSTMYADGVRWVRIDTPNTSTYDAIVQSAIAAHLQVDLLVEDWDLAHPDSPSALSSLVTSIAQHYAPLGVHTYEILNEENNPDYYSSTGSGMSAASYTALLKSAYTAVHQADPAATVISGGFATGSGAAEPYNYLTAMYAAGAHGYFDAIADHPYAFPDLPNSNDPLYNPWQYLPMGWGASSCGGAGTADCLYSIMSSNGDGAKKIWLTEFGAPTGTDGGYTAYGHSFQAASITQAFQNANSVSYDGAAVFNFQWQDDSEGDFGLVDTSGNPKSGLTAFEDAAQGVPPPAATLTSGTTLASGQTITNYNTGWSLTMQTDGNLVLNDQLGDAEWASATFGNPGASLSMQSDGNLVIYSTAGQALWATDTYSNNGAYLSVNDDGNLLVYSATGQQLWSESTLLPGQGLQSGAQITDLATGWNLDMQGDGNLVLYDSQGVAEWASNTSGNSGATASMQNDGNFVVNSSAGAAIWSSGTYGNSNAKLTLLDDGDLEVTSTSGAVLWQTGT